MANSRYNTQVANKRVAMKEGGKVEDKYRKIAKGRLTERAKQINQKKADSFAKNLGGKGGPKITSKDKEALRFIKKVEARDATGKKSAIDTMAKGIKKREESPANVERGMGTGYKKGGKVLKAVDKEKNPGLAKLPTQVRNKMGFMKKGGRVKKSKKKYM